MTRRTGLRVYVAGPYTLGDVALNVRAAVLAAETLRNAGHFPYVPHLSHYWHTMFPRGYEDWMELGLAYLITCHAMVRLPGESPGSDREVAFARAHGIPVYGSVMDLIYAQEASHDAPDRVPDLAGVRPPAGS